MEIVKVIEIGNTVICDLCNKDYSESLDVGGFLFGSNAYCPVCAEENLPIIKKYKEENFIKAFCPKNQSFRDFVLDLRNGRNTIEIKRYNDVEELFNKISRLETQKT